MTVVSRSFEVHKLEYASPEHALDADLKRRPPRSNLVEQIKGLIYMRASYKWFVGCTLLVGLLGGASVCAKSTEVRQQVHKRNRDKIAVLTIGAHGAGSVYTAKKSYGHADSVPDSAENEPFDIFCSSFDTEWFQPGQNSSTSALQRFQGPSSKPAIPTRRRYQLRPC